MDHLAREKDMFKAGYEHMAGTAQEIDHRAKLTAQKAEQDGKLAAQKAEQDIKLVEQDASFKEKDLRSTIERMQMDMKAQASNIATLRRKVDDAEKRNSSLNEKLEKTRTEYAALQKAFAEKSVEFDDLLERFENQEIQATYALQERTEAVNKLAAKDAELSKQKVEIDSWKRKARDADRAAEEAKREATRKQSLAADWERKCVAERESRAKTGATEGALVEAAEREREALVLRVDALDDDKQKMEAILDNAAIAQGELQKEIDCVKGEKAELVEHKDALEEKLESAESEIARLKLVASDDLSNARYTE